MRIVWRDSTVPKEYEPIKYRKVYIFGSPDGWEVNIKDDSNLYKTHYCAQNAIDKHYGDFGTRGTEKRRKYGIQIIGTTDKYKCL